MTPQQTNRERFRHGRSADHLPRMKNPTYDIDVLRKAIISSTRHQQWGWAVTTFIAKALGVSRSTAYKWLCDAASRGLIETEEQWSYVHSKSVLSRHWRVKDMQTDR